jgi:YidC/Oxa1 family membrane protein insertase
MNANSELRLLLTLALIVIAVIFCLDYFKPKPATQTPSRPQVFESAQNGSSGKQALKANAEAKEPKLKPLAEHAWISVIANPIYKFLRYLHGYLGPGANNWGWAIVIVTFLINLCLLPARLAMMNSSLKTARLQPKLDAIKKRYAHLKINDPKKTEMQTEIMALYKSEGVNMYGSCLPMLIQMPLLYAIYRVLAGAVELHQAHWFWISDLAAPDPLHILPIFVIASMSVTQFISAQPGMDAAQRRIMALILPVAMGFMMWHLSAGLSLYWGTGNLIGLVIQLLINQSKAGKEVRSIFANRSLAVSRV